MGRRTMAWALRIALGVVLAAGAVLPAGCSGLKRNEEEVHFGTELTTPAEYESKVVRSGKPALVDFHATWCPPCRQLAPILARLEREYAGKIDFFRVDVDRAAALAAEHEIEGYPTVLLVRGGRTVDRILGLRPEKELRRRLDQLLAGQ